MENDFLDFDRLHSYEDRQAVNQALRSKFAPPEGLVGLYEQLQKESQSVSSDFIKKSKEVTPEQKSFNNQLNKALQAQKDIFNQTLINLFFQKTTEMLNWVKRFKFSEPNANWNPQEWVEMSEKLGCEDQFITIIIEQSSSLSLKAWYRSLNLSKSWERKWMGWNRSFHAAPAIAMKWLPAFLEALSHSDVKPERRRYLLSHARGINWFRHFLFKETGRNAETLEFLDSSLADLGVERDLSCIDYSPLFITGDASFSISLATEKLYEFLESCPRDALKWLKQERLSKIDFKFGNEFSEDALFLKYLRALSIKNQAGHADLKALVFAWHEHSESDAEGWDDFLPPGLIHYFKGESPSLILEDGVDAVEPPEIEISLPPPPSPLQNSNQV